MVERRLISLIRRLLRCNPAPGLVSRASEKSSPADELRWWGGGVDCQGAPEGEGLSYPALDISLVDVGGVSGKPSTTIEGISVDKLVQRTTLDEGVIP